LGFVIWNLSIKGFSMQIIDLSHDLYSGMPLYPGTDQPEFTDNNRFESDGYREKKIIMTSHIGTHIDAPAHIIEDGKMLDQLPVETYFGTAYVLNVSQYAGTEIDADYLLNYAQKIREIDFILFYTGYSDLWGSDRYFTGFPVLSIAAAEWVAEHVRKGVGWDACSADPVGSADLPIHNILLGHGLVMVENLTNLASLLAKNINFSCLPLKICGADGSPIRAVGII
jgi:arylformamidase